jgi:hypothetical protein
VTPQQIEQTLTSFIDTIKAMVNKEVAQRGGLRLPLPEIFKVERYTKDPSIEGGDGYYLIQADVRSAPSPSNSDNGDR